MNGDMNFQWILNRGQTPNFMSLICNQSSLTLLISLSLTLLISIDLLFILDFHGGYDIKQLPNVWFC